MSGSASEGIIEGLESPVAVNRGIYYSTNAGLTWQAANVSDSGVRVTSASITAVVYNQPLRSFTLLFAFTDSILHRTGSHGARVGLSPGLDSLPQLVHLKQRHQAYARSTEEKSPSSPIVAGSNNLGEMYAWYVDANSAIKGFGKV